MTGTDKAMQLLYPHGPFRARVLVDMVKHHWFIRLRWIMVFAAIALLLLERWQVSTFQRPPAVAICIAVVAAVNLLWTAVGLRLLQRSRHEPSAPIRSIVAFANAQMTVDLLLLTVILRYSGGVENPMAIFYLFHMLIAALLLRPFNALLQGVWAIVLYSILGFGECLEWITPHYAFTATTADSALHTSWRYVLAAVGVLSAGVVGTLYFTLQISSRLDEQERELHDANTALRSSRDAVQRLQKRRSRFMRTAAHQLKSPLTGIETLAGLIRDKVVSTEGIGDIIARIVRRCREGMVQVNELLALERIEQAGPGRHRGAVTDVSGAIHHVISRFGEQARGKNIALHHTVQRCTEVYAAVDSRDFEDCLSNLVDNAIKYTSPRGRVDLLAKCDENEIHICVKDTGMGIAEENMDELFEPFRRGNLALAANVSGSGLGLAIVKEVVEQAGGRVEVSSNVGMGTQFTLRIPTSRVPPGMGGHDPAARTGDPPTLRASRGDEELLQCSTV